MKKGNKIIGGVVVAGVIILGGSVISIINS